MMESLTWQKFYTSLKIRFCFRKNYYLNKPSMADSTWVSFGSTDSMVVCHRYLIFRFGWIGWFVLKGIILIVKTGIGQTFNSVYCDVKARSFQRQNNFCSFWQFVFATIEYWLAVKIRAIIIQYTPLIFSQDNLS